LLFFAAVDDFQNLANVPLVLSGEQQSQQMAIGIVDDRIAEGNETFQVLLSLLSSDGRVRLSPPVQALILLLWTMIQAP